MTHGQRSTYVKGCRCADCRAANSRYAKLAKYRQDTGRTVMVDAEPIKQHLHKLRAAGVGKRTIASQAGVSQTVVDRLLGLNSDRPAERIRPETASRLLGVSTTQLANGAYIDAIGTTRRLQALVAIGHSQTSLAERVGWTLANLNVLVLGRRDSVTVATAQLIAQLYDELSMTPGTNARARSLAQGRNWAPPLAWDDDKIDDPGARPHGRDTSARWLHKSRDMAALVEDFSDMRNAGATFASAASRLGMSEQALERALYRARKSGFTVPGFNKENAA